MTNAAQDETPVLGAEPAELDAQRLAGLVFELASQLHAERLQRLALEHALQTAGLLDRESLDAAAAAQALRVHGREAVEASVARLMRVITEHSDPRTPLRGMQGGV